VDHPKPVSWQNTLSATANRVYLQAVRELRQNDYDRTATSASHEIVPAMRMKKVKGKKI
jgi:hypothetical protein